MTSYLVREHPLIEVDLAEIFVYVRDYAGKRSADGKLNDLLSSIESLSALPHIGTKRDEILPGLRAIPSAEKGVIAFRVDDEAREVHVLCISYAGQDWQRESRRRSRTMPG